MTEPQPQRIDRRRVRTRAALLRAGQQLFSERSVDGVSIDDIVAAAQVAKGSFYNHFPDKDALAQALADQARASVETTAAIAGAGFADPAERVARALCVFVRQAVEHPESSRLMLRLFHGASIPDAPMNAGVRADIQEGLAAGRFAGIGLEAAILLAVGAVQIAVARAIEREAPNTDALAADLALGLLRGLGVADAPAVAARAAAGVFKMQGKPS